MALTIQSFMPSDAECAEALREVRWATGLQCLYCGSRAVVRRGWRKGLYRRYRCKGCGRWFNDRSGTVLAHSKLPLRAWFFAAFQMQSKVSVRELAETLQLPYPTVFRMVRRLRENLYLAAPTLRLKGVVEMDEAYVKAGLKGKRNLKRPPRVRGLKRRGRGTYAVDKPPILGLVERGGLVRLIPMADVAAKTVLRRLLKAVDVEDLEALYTDGYPAYRVLRSVGCHETVNHSQGEYVRGRVHTNTVEGEFSVFRPWSATFRGYGKENIRLYTAQYNFTRNNRHLGRVERTLAMLLPSQMPGCGSAGPPA